MTELEAAGSALLLRRGLKSVGIPVPPDLVGMVQEVRTLTEDDWLGSRLEAWAMSLNPAQRVLLVTVLETIAEGIRLGWLK